MTVVKMTETENLDVNLEATHGRYNRPFYETANTTIKIDTMYFKDENDWFEAPLKINTPVVSSNLGTIGGSSILKDRVHIFIVYEMERQYIKKTNDFTTIFVNKGKCSGIYRMLGFKNLDNASAKRLIVYGVGNDYLEINPNVFPLKTDPTEYKMKCISVHYDRETYPLTSDNSRIFCNGKLIKKFTSAQVTSGLSTLIFRGSNKTVTNDRVTDCFQGKIAFIAIQLRKKNDRKRNFSKSYCIM